MHSKTLRVGVIGTEYGGSVHIPALRHIAEVEIAAICGSTLERARDVATRFQIPEFYDDYRLMFTRAGLDAVSIATPPDRHHAAAIAAAEHGLHTLCEVPIARSAAEARDMLRLARDARIQHVVAFSTRFTPSRIYFKQLISSGYIGDLRSVSVTVLRSQDEKRTRIGYDPSFARSTTPLQMIGVNFVDTLRWCFGEIHAVAGARSSIQSRSETVQSDHEFSSLLQFASGALGTIHVCTDCPVDLGDEIVAVGSGGMLALRGDDRLFGTRSHEQMLTELTIPDELTSMFQGFVDPRVGPLTVLANEWVHGILRGDCQAPSFEDGMKVQEVVDSIVRSQELSRWIDTSGKKWPV